MAASHTSRPLNLCGKNNRLRLSNRKPWPVSSHASLPEEIMTISRRKFLRAGTVAALAAGIPLKSVLVANGQGNRKERDANPGNGSFDPLSYYTKSAFAA